MLGIEAMFFRLFMENHPICAAATVTNSVVSPTDVTYVEPNRAGSGEGEDASRQVENVPSKSQRIDAVYMQYGPICSMGKIFSRILNFLGFEAAGSVEVQRSIKTLGFDGESPWLPHGKNQKLRGPSF